MFGHGRSCRMPSRSWNRELGSALGTYTEVIWGGCLNRRLQYWPNLSRSQLYAANKDSTVRPKRFALRIPCLRGSETFGFPQEPRTFRAGAEARSHSRRLRGHKRPLFHFSRLYRAILNLVQGYASMSRCNGFCQSYSGCSWRCSAALKFRPQA